MTGIEIVLGYHEATRHHPHRYARSAGFLDWDSQPEAFRRYLGVETIPLPLDTASSHTDFDAVIHGPRPAPMPVTLESLGVFLRHSLAISAWKAAGGNTWALRCNPSSGNLHPTEGYLAIGPTQRLCTAPTIFHYAPDAHAFEARATSDPGQWAACMAELPPETFLIGLSSIYWREAWKYGERAFRYCQHDTGHALAALSVASSLCGWRVTLIEDVSDTAISRLFGLHEGSLVNEGETPELLALVTPDSAPVPVTDLSDAALAAMPLSPLHGAINRLSSDHVNWQIIDVVSEATRKPPDATLPTPWAAPALPVTLSRGVHCDAETLLLNRRSAQAMDGHTTLSREGFFRILAALQPRAGGRPWDAWPWEPCIHLAIFVHRVDGIQPGLYLFPRSEKGAKALRGALHPHFEWSHPPRTPESLPLYLLEPGDYRETSAALSCNQDIASDGCCCVVMLAAFEGPLRHYGPWYYRRLFWEAGMAGQMLYLGAEAEGLQGTGIGCYFDDETHRVLGLDGWAFQSIYHFTIGAGVTDLRVTTLPAYAPRMTD